MFSENKALFDRFYEILEKIIQLRLNTSEINGIIRIKTV